MFVFYIKSNFKWTFLFVLLFFIFTPLLFVKYSKFYDTILKKKVVLFSVDKEVTDQYIATSISVCAYNLVIVSKLSSYKLLPFVYADSPCKRIKTCWSFFKIIVLCSALMLHLCNTLSLTKRKGKKICYGLIEFGN